MALEEFTAFHDLESPLATADLQLISEAIPHIVWLAEADGYRDYFNHRAVLYTGMPASALMGRGWLQAVHPDDAARAERIWLNAVKRSKPFETHQRVRRFDGEYRRLVTRGLPIHRPDGAVLRWIGTWTDVEEERRLLDELRESELRSAEDRALTDAALTATPIVFVCVDRDLRVRRMNDSFANFAGITADPIGARLSDLIPDLWPDVADRYRHVLETGETLRDVEVTRIWPNGEARHALNTYYPIRVDDAIVGTAMMSIDITELKRAHSLRTAILDHMAEGVFTLDSHGRVTSLNRAAERMLGWTEADVIGQRAHDLWHHMRGDGTPLFESEWESSGLRVGGNPIWVEDSFTTRKGSLLPVAYSAGAIEQVGGEQGVVVVFRDTTDQQSAQRRAQRNLEALQWVGRIRDALDDNRFVLYSQPIVPLNPALPDAEELLLRMRSHSGEVVLPGTFLPAAEKYGLIADIDRWVIAQAARLAARGRRVEANLSAWTITNVDLIPYIERVLTETGADPDNLVLEITETAFMRDFERGEAFAHGLAALGCHLALDDFGTGFGGFTYLKRLPITYLKIDVDFVRELLSHPANQRVVEAIVALARGLDKFTIAEGVEDPNTLQILRSLGVDYAQGYLLGRPAPIRDHSLLTLW